MQKDHGLLAISPIDGRYSSKTVDLSPYFSEYALIKYRVIVEILYFLALKKTGISQLSGLTDVHISAIQSIASEFGPSEAARVKSIEATTNHDVKAVEYYIAEKFELLGLRDYIQWIHFGLTSQDINNTAFPFMLKTGVEDVVLPKLTAVLSALEEKSELWGNVPMLARTHGQPASPTTMGKEIRVFADRLKKQYTALQNHIYEAKFGGATGNFNAHISAMHHVDWPSFADIFISGFGMQRQQYTTQIDQYDNIAGLFHNFCRINTILLDLCKDIWQYVSMEYLIQKPVESEVGSSTMPHKINPIDFENAEGNLGWANAQFLYLASKLPVSRLQRDLTDSTVLRNAGVPLAHSLIAYKSIIKGLAKLEIHTSIISEELEKHWIILAEPIQTILRRESVSNGYELLKSFTRGKSEITREELHQFIDSLPVDDAVKLEMKELTPHNYTGNA